MADEQVREGAAALARRRLAQSRARQRVYLAGKISKNDWRHSLAHLEWNDNGERPEWGPASMRGYAHLECVGPFFIRCDHGCAHGPSSHGVGANGLGDGCLQSPLRRYQVVGRCLDAIDRCDVLFAWVDDPTAHGTLVEIGYARAAGKFIVVATHPHISPTVQHDMWFAFSVATVTVTAAGPVEAFRAAVPHFPVGKS